MADTIKLKVESATEADVFEYKKLVEEKMAAVEEKVDNIREDLNLDNFLTKEEIADYALKTELPDISVKQDVISDLEEIRLGASLGKTSIQEHQSLDGYAKLEDIPAPQDLSSYALKSEIPTIPDHSVYALKTEIPDVSTKADSSNVYTKTEIDTMLGDMDTVLTALGV